MLIWRAYTGGTLTAPALNQPLSLNHPVSLFGSENIAEVSNMVFQVTVYTEDDGSITLSTDDMDLAVNAPSKEAAIKALCRDIVEYAEEYRKAFAMYSAAPNRAAHAPLVKEILSVTPQELRDALVFHPEQMRPKHPHKTVTERLEEYYHTPVDQIKPTKEDEMDWGKPQGDEIW